MPHDWKQQKNLIMIDCTCSKGEKGAVYSPVMFKPPLRSSGRRFILQGSVFVSQRCRPGVLSCGTHSSQQPAAILQVPTSGHLSTRTYTRARRERERESTCIALLRHYTALFTSPCCPCTDRHSVVVRATPHCVDSAPT